MGSDEPSISAHIRRNRRQQRFCTRRLNLTQSAASRQVHALETELGVRLFDRIGRGLS
jgi:hypothetical protein